MEATDTIPSAWYRALDLRERCAAGVAAPAAAQDEARARATRRLARWRRIPVHAGDEHALAARLARDGLDPDGLVALLAEPPDALAQRLGALPADLDAVARALERPRTGAAGGLPAVVEATPFQAACLRIVEPLTARAVARLRRGLRARVGRRRAPPFDAECTLAPWAQNLPPALAMMFVRTLALEVNLARMRGRLRGDTPGARFDAFVARLCRPAHRRAFFREYPVLARQVAQALDHWVEAGVEAVERLAGDWAALRASLLPGADPGAPVTLEGGAGDGHRRGRSVLRLRFECGAKLIYKPRALSLDAHFQALLGFINARLAARAPAFPALRTLSILDRGDYGWCEFVEAGGCETRAQVERFFLRQGAYLALLHGLEAVDFHAENLIASGEHPVLVDLEALFHPRIERHPPGGFDDPALRAWQRSVLRVGLLPERDESSETDAGYDISGLGHRPGQVMAKPVPVMEGMATDEMHLAHRRLELDSNPNAPTLDGATVAALDYQEQVSAGFETLYRTLLGERERLLAEVLPRFRDATVRVILLPTRVYDRILRTSFHPDFLRDALERERVFERLWRPAHWPPEFAEVAPRERADLLAGDIPYFHTRAASRDLFDSRGERIEGFLAESGYDAAARRLAQLDEADLARQLWIVRGAFATIPLGKGEERWGSYSPHPAPPRAGRGRLLAEARAIGDRLARLAFVDDGHASWLGVSLLKEREWRLLPVGGDLYNGTSGIALFLAYLGRLCGEARYTRLARAALATTLAQAEASAAAATAPPAVGAYAGASAPVYLLAHLGALWREPGLLDRAEELAAGLTGAIDADRNYDLLEGTAGCLAGLLALDRVRPSAPVRALAARCGEHLLARAQPVDGAPGIHWPGTIPAVAPLTGVSHGAAGIALALARLFALTGDRRYRDATQGALAYERSTYSPQAGNWPDYRAIAYPQGVRAGTDREQAIRPRYMTAWCHGAPGIGLARLGVRACLDEPALEAEIDAALRATLRAGAGHNHCLCHGDLGNLELPLSVASAEGRRAAGRLADAVAESFAHHGWISGIPFGVESPGLMSGLAGIGYGLLRLCDPEAVPGVLLLEPPRRD